MPRRHPAALAAALALTIAAGPARAADDAGADALLGRVVAAYKALPAYADQGTVRLDFRLNGEAKNQSSKANLAFARPNRLRLDLDAVRVACDGKTLHSAVTPLKRYTAAPAPDSFADFDVSAGPLAATLLGGPSGLPPLMVFNLLTADDPTKLFDRFAGSFKLEDDRELDGKPHRALLLDAAEGPDFRFLVDPETHLVRSIELAFDPSAFADKVPGTEVRVERFAWDAGTIETAAPDDLFAFEAPDDFAKVATLAEAFGDDAPGVGQEEKSPLLGKPAPVFSLEVFDGPGKTRRVSKADLEGKVVVIDFWATWCGPCLKELPDIAKMIESYAEAKKDVAVVALSLDEADDPAQARKLIEATLKKLEIDLSGSPVGLVAHDADGTLGKVYGVKAIPMVVVIDQKGIVQAVHVGYTERDVLEREVDALLAGESLVGAKGE